MIVPSSGRCSTTRRNPSWKRNWCTGTSIRRASAASPSRSSVVRSSGATGFSTTTWAPAASESRTTSTCASTGVQTWTTSTRPDASASPRSRYAEAGASEDALARSGSTTAASEPPARVAAAACQRPIVPAPTTATLGPFVILGGRRCRGVVAVDAPHSVASPHRSRRPCPEGGPPALSGPPRAGPPARNRRVFGSAARQAASPRRRPRARRSTARPRHRAP